MDPSGAPFQDEIALLTGELYTVSEITEDGGGVRWSPDGLLAAYESGTGSGGVTHLLRLEGEGLVEVSQVMGSGLVFAPRGGEVAFLVLEEGEGLDAARARLQEEIAPTDRASFMRLRTETTNLESWFTHIVMRDLSSGKDRSVKPDGVGVQSLLYGPAGGDLFFVGSFLEGDGSTQLFRLTGDGGAEVLTDGPGRKDTPFFTAGGDVVVYGMEAGSFGILHLASGAVRVVDGTGPVVSADGSTLAFLGGSEGGPAISVLSVSDPAAAPRLVARTEFPLGSTTSRACLSCPPLASLALSPDGSRVVFQGMPREDWDLFTLPTGGEEVEPRRLTREIQHDLSPQFLATGGLLAVKGEGGHRRSFLYDPDTSAAIRLFRNNWRRTSGNPWRRYRYPGSSTMRTPSTESAPSTSLSPGTRWPSTTWWRDSMSSGTTRSSSGSNLGGLGQRMSWFASRGP
jgi:hypothetical protein